MKNNFKTAFIKALATGRVLFSKPANKKTKTLYTREPLPGMELYFLRLEHSNPVCYVKPVNENSAAITYQILPGKEGAALFTPDQVKQFINDFNGKGLKSERYINGNQ